MAETHREQAIRKMKEHHEAAKKADARGDSAETKRLMAKAFHAADVAKSIDAGKPVGSVDPKKDFSKGSPVRSASGGGVSGGAAGTTTTSIPVPGSTPFKRTRMGYDPDTMVDYTNTNPAYWASAVSYFKNNPNGNRSTGELGIWIPNFEKEGAERTALAAIAGGVTAHVNSNYANRTVTDAGRKTATESYRGGPTEKAIRLAGVHRGGTDATDRPMGSTASSEHGVYIKGGVVTKGAGADYVKGGGDFGGLLSVGDTITGDWLTGILGGMDKDGMRLGGTYAPVRGATGSGIGAGGTDITAGGTYAGGVDPLAKMPGVADYTPYMDPNSMFAGLSDNESVKSGLLYQPTASNYGARMEAAGMPAFSPGLLSSFTPAGAPTYGSTPGSFMKPATGGATGGGGGVIGGAGTSYLWPEYFKGDAKSKYPALSKYAPKYASEAALRSAYGGGSPYHSFMKAHPESGGFAKIMDTGRVFRTGLGTEYEDHGDGWVSGKAYAAKT